MANNKSFLLIRNGQPQKSHSRAVSDWALSPQGIRQVNDLVEQISKRKIESEIFTSGEAAALESSQIICNTMNKKMNVITRLREINRKPFHDMSREEFVKVSTELFQYRYQPVVGNESADLAKCRFAEAIQEIEEINKHDWFDERIVVTHGIVISLFLAEYNDIDPLGFWARLNCCDAVKISAGDYQIQEIIKKS